MIGDNERVRITPSVFDRLLDFDPRESAESPKSRTTSVADLKRAVLRDLEWLLNTRQPIFADERLEESKGTVIFFGVPDFTGLGVRNHAEFKKFVNDIETAIRWFEPRIFDVEITFEPVSDVDRQMKFRVEARLDIDPTPEPITFDSVIHGEDGRISIVAR
jgi:type VI secretion system protein ImpF